MFKDLTPTSGRQASGKVPNGPHPKFITVSFSDYVGTGCTQEIDNSRVERRCEVCPENEWDDSGRGKDRPLSMAEEHVVGMSAVAMLSLIAMAALWRGPLFSADSVDRSEV